MKEPKNIDYTSFLPLGGGGAVRRRFLISPLEGEKKFLSELCELRNFREGYKKYKNSDRATKCAMTNVGDKKGKIKMNENNLQQKQPNNLTTFLETNHSPLTIHHSLKRKTAFTLAEVLITLGIIGVVATLTLPTLIQNYQKRAVATRLEATYSILAQAIMLSENDNGPERGWQINQTDYKGARITENFIKTYIEPYLKTVKRDELRASSPDSPYDYYYRTNGKLERISGHWNYCIVLANGVYLFFDANYAVSNLIKVYIDINGKQLPNIIGKDIFISYLFPEFKGLTWTSASSSDIRKALVSMCSSGTWPEQAVGCFSLIKYDGWQIKKDYPW